MIIADPGLIPLGPSIFLGSPGCTRVPHVCYSSYMARGRTAQTAQTEDNVSETQIVDEAQDANEATAENTPEAGTEAAGHKFNEGDTASVIRGKFRGRAGSIVSYAEAENQYAIKLDGGTLAVVNAGNLKAPVDSTISVRALVEALAGFGQDANGPDRDAAVRLATMLDSVAPGTSVKLNEAFSA